jgi:hypothetical protein
MDTPGFASRCAAFPGSCYTGPETGETMADRRQFLQSLLVLSAATVPGVLPMASAARRATRADWHLERFVFDERFPAAVTLARRAARDGIPLSATSGDLMDLWYHELDLRWRAAPMTLGGMTTRSDLFVLETFAADRGMRVAHRVPLSDSLVSWVIAPRRQIV